MEVCSGTNGLPTPRSPTDMPPSPAQPIERKTIMVYKLLKRGGTNARTFGDLSTLVLVQALIAAGSSTAVLSKHCRRYVPLANQVTQALIAAHMPTHLSMQVLMQIEIGITCSLLHQTCQNLLLPLLLVHIIVFRMLLIKNKLHNQAPLSNRTQHTQHNKVRI